MKIALLPFFLLFMYATTRDLFIFYNTQSAVLKNRQLAELDKDKNGIAERDIAIRLVQADKASADVIRYHIDTSRAFTIILIGKDGGEKLRSDSVIPVAKLFAVIDAMPMRKAETRNK